MLETRETHGVSLRIIKDGRVGLAATSNQKDVAKLVSTAVELAGFGSPTSLELPNSATYPLVNVYDPLVEEVSIENMIEIGESLIDRIREGNADLLCDGRVAKSVSTVSLKNSKGVDVSYTKSVFSIGMEAMLVRGEDMLFVGERKSSCNPITDTTFIKESIQRQLELSERVADPITGSLPVIFTPYGVAGALLGPLLAGFNGRNIVQGSSPLVGRLGEQIVDKQISIWDDPLLPYVPGSRTIDDEGVPSQRNALIDCGVATKFFYDLQTACQAGTVSTGSASRSLGSLPSPSVGVLVIGEGGLSYDDMVKDIEEGLIVESFLGAGMGNVLAGDFDANVLLGYRVSKGKPVGRVKNTMISGNVYQALSNLLAVGSDPRWLGGSLKAPALYCRDISVSAKSG